MAFLIPFSLPILSRYYLLLLLFALLLGNVTPSDWQFVFLAESLLIVEEPKTRFHNHPRSQSPIPAPACPALPCGYSSHQADDGHRGRKEIDVFIKIKTFPLFRRKPFFLCLETEWRRQMFQFCEMQCWDSAMTAINFSNLEPISIF